MSASFFAVSGSNAAHEFSSEYIVQTEGPRAPNVPMPPEAESREADALRGAISFLFMLIASYNELIAKDAVARGFAGCRDRGLH